MGDRWRFWRAGAVVATVALLCGLASGCGTVQVERSWRSPAFAGPGFRKVLVVGMAGRPEVRRMYEDAFVGQLEARGVQGVASYSVLADGQMTDQQAVGRAADRSGADAVLVTRLVKTERQDVVIAPAPRMQEYIDTAWPGTYTPTVAGQTEIVTLETRLFDGAGRLAWSGTTRTFDAADLPLAVSHTSRTVVREMAKQGLIRSAA